jgi:hypothetical protein
MYCQQYTLPAMYTARNIYCQQCILPAIDILPEIYIGSNVYCRQYTCITIYQSPDRSLHTHSSATQRTLSALP